MQSLKILVGGTWSETGSNGVFEVINPADEKVLYSGPAAGEREVLWAIDVARKGLDDLAGLLPVERMRIMIRTAELLRRNRSDLAEWLRLETGKIDALANAEVALSADQFEWYAGEAMRVFERSAPTRQAGFRYRVRREPVGIAAAFVSWNFPILLLARKFAPAFAAGCPMLVKPAEQGSMAVQKFVEIMLEAGLPETAIALLPGRSEPISAAVMQSFDVRKVSFTGSTRIGRHLFRESAETLKKLSLELGGHSPVVVDNDIVLDDVVDPICQLKFRNAGQVCTSPTRFYVVDDIYAEFVDRFVATAETLKIGDPSGDEPVDIGPLITAHRVEAVDRLVQDAVASGCRLATGGARPADRNAGYYYTPTVLTDVPDSAAIMTEEPFGPVAVINRVGSFSEAIERANATRYGLTAYAYSNDPANMERAGSGLNFGVVAVNQFFPALAEAPMGGRNESGFGSEGGTEGIGEYLITKFIHEKVF
jgi:succinate-semialdehyde dehydrogenase/glutarate-semialdehyde dehydrogenase